VRYTAANAWWCALANNYRVANVMKTFVPGLSSARLELLKAAATRAHDEYSLMSMPRAGKPTPVSKKAAAATATSSGCGNAQRRCQVSDERKLLATALVDVCTATSLCADSATLVLEYAVSTLSGTMPALASKIVSHALDTTRVLTNQHFALLFPNMNSMDVMTRSFVVDHTLHQKAYKHWLQYPSATKKSGSCMYRDVLASLTDCKSWDLLLSDLNDGSPATWLAPRSAKTAEAAVKKATERDLRAWGTRRVTSTFCLLEQRADGAICIDVNKENAPAATNMTPVVAKKKKKKLTKQELRKQLKKDKRRQMQQRFHKVYLVKGLTAPLGDAFPGVDPPFLCNLTLVPFANRITTDGCIQRAAPGTMPAQRVKDMQHVYAEALQHGKLIDRFRVKEVPVFEHRKRCANCGVASDSPILTLSLCARCKTVWYCGRSCQSAHWKQHKAQGCVKGGAKADARQKAPQDYPITLTKELDVLMQQIVKGLKFLGKVNHSGFIFRRFAYKPEENPQKMCMLYEYQGDSGKMMRWAPFTMKQYTYVLGDIIRGLHKCVKDGVYPMAVHVDYNPLIPMLEALLKRYKAPRLPVVRYRAQLP
jgi:hypothetical protein